MTEFKIRNHSAFKYARSVIKEYSRSFSIIAYLLPCRHRWAVFAMYGFCRYAHNLTEKPRMRTPDEIHDEIENLKQEMIIAYRTGESRHPVVTSFIEVASHFRIPLEYPLEFLKGVAMDIEHQPFPTFQELECYCRRVSGVIGIMMAHILGFDSIAALPYAEKLGLAMHMTNILRDVQDDCKQGHCFLPKDELNNFSVTTEMLKFGPMKQEVAHLMRSQVDRVHLLYEDAQPGIAMLNKESRLTVYSASKIYRSILYKIESNQYNPFKKRVQLSNWEKMQIVLGGWAKNRS